MYKIGKDYKDDNISMMPLTFVRWKTVQKKSFSLTNEFAVMSFISFYRKKEEYNNLIQS